MTINLNVNSNMQNYYVNNTNTDADGGGSVMPSHEAGANGYTYGDAVEISLSANAQSYNAEQVPNGERPPVGETVVVWGRVRETSAGGASSFSGWAETNGGDNSEYHYYGDVTAEETPPETQLIDNKAVEKPSYYKVSNGRLIKVMNKTDTLKELRELKSLAILLKGGGELAALKGISSAKSLQAAIALVEKSPMGVLIWGSAIGLNTYLDYQINEISMMPDDWTHEIDLGRDMQDYERIWPKDKM